VGVVFGANLAAVGQGLVGQVLNFGRAQNAFGRAHAQPIVRGDEVEEGGRIGQLLQPGGPLAQGGGVAGVRGVQDQRRQGEVVDQLGFVAAVAKVGDVLGVVHVGFGDEQHVGGDRVQH